VKNFYQTIFFVTVAATAAAAARWWDIPGLMKNYTTPYHTPRFLIRYGTL